MSKQTTRPRRDEPIGRQTLVAFAAAFTVVVLLRALSPARVAAASTVGAAVVRGTLVVTGTPSANRIALRLSRTSPKRLQVDFGDADLDTLALSTLSGTDAVAMAPAVLGLIQVTSGA